MAKLEQITIIISELELFLIDRIRELRGRAVPYISQVDLSIKMEYSEGYIGKVENFKTSSKYNLRSLNLIANSLGLESYTELLPTTILKNDLLELTIEVKGSNDRVDFDENNQVIKNYNIIKKRILTKKEIKEFNTRRSKKSS
ncbi:transcriptional regulator [Myroides sp. DF42-4-2]|uniref:transcriptional regulator n=1 Tax=Myroides sp. DF42-4-2 TaxID=2746726 RepID=UPI0025786F41|nr:transcriptional regulator [Myroides sp. DF42-4-2]MDM1408226.1 transcriptional regulator [Myroides sp. DF42-4-2]